MESQPETFASDTEAGAEAVFPHAPEIIWKAITGGDEARHWLAVTGSWPSEPAAGARYWTRSTGFGYMAFEYVAVDPGSRFAARGLSTGRLFTWEVTPAEGGTRLRAMVQRGPNDPRWDADREHNSEGYAAVLSNLRRYLDGRFDMQRFPYFGVRTEVQREGGTDVHVVIKVFPWAEAAGVRVGDRFIAVNGQPVPKSPFPSSPLFALNQTYRAGETVALTVQRAGTRSDIQFTLPSWRQAAALLDADLGPPPVFDAR